MINHETMVFDAVSAALRDAFDVIFISGVELVDTPPQFPAVSIVQTNNEVNMRGSTFEHIENAAIETYTFNIFSNLESLRDAKNQIQTIAEVIDEVMSGLFYPRIFSQPVANADAKISRRIVRYTKNDVTMEV